MMCQFSVHPAGRFHFNAIPLQNNIYLLNYTPRMYHNLPLTTSYNFLRFGAMDVTKPYDIIGFWAMDVTKHYEFIGFFVGGVIIHAGG